MPTNHGLLGALNLSLYPDDVDESGLEDDKSWLTFLDGRAYLVFDISSLILTLVLIFIIFNLKLMPGIWHLRILNAFRFTIKSLQPPVAPCKNNIFQPMVTESTAPLMEIDFNLHKSNSSYFADLDISRTHLVCTLFVKGIEQMRGGTGAFTGSKLPHFALALGAVNCNFSKEIQPYQKYQMWSRILTWDEKWIYIVTHFVRDDRLCDDAQSSLYPPEIGETDGKSGRSNGSRHQRVSESDINEMLNCQENIMATALSRCVFKSGRKTVSPDAMLRLSGLLDSNSGPEQEMVEIDAVEMQRQEGFRAASSLAMENQKMLEAEFGFSAKGQILARHSDGTGFRGVVLTLMQLVELRKSQCL